MRQPERKWTNEEIAQASEKIKHSLVQKPENYPHPHDLIEKGRKYNELKASHERLQAACLDARFDLHVRKVMQEKLTKSQLSILKNLEQAIIQAP